MELGIDLQEEIVNFTKEQEIIFNAHDDTMIIEAVAGSGKTTTLFEYMKRHPNEKFLYLVFNKKMKDEAEEKKRKLRINNVEVSTIHSFCLRNRITHSNNKEIKNMNVYEIAQKLDLKIDIVKEYISIYTLFLNSEYLDTEIADFIKSYSVDLLTKINNISTKEIEDEIPENIQSGIKKFIIKLLKAMASGSISRNFDFILKDFHCFARQVNKYDTILIDEAQDINPVMFEIIKTKFPNSRKIFVGDSLQQIYMWRGAVNSLQRIDGTKYSLTNSFRVGKDIENLVKKTYKEIDVNIELTGTNNKNVLVESIDQNEKFTFLARTNATLVLFAMENLHKKIHIPENIKFDILMDVYKFWAYSDKNKNYALMPYKNFKELKGDNDKGVIFDNELSLSIMLVERYEDDIPDIINNLKDVTIKDMRKAEIILMTAHSTKGLEFEKVIVADDFITIKEINKKKKKLEHEIRTTKSLKKKKRLKRILENMLGSIQEEFNVKYVAFTRSFGEIEIDYPLNTDEDKIKIEFSISEGSFLDLEDE